MAESSSDGAVTFALYRYTPSIPAAVIMAVAFGFLAVSHAYRLIREKTYFFIPFIIGLVFEAAGYIARIFSHFDTLALGPYIVQTMLILIAPPLFAASIYMTLGRLLREMGAESASIVRVKWLTKIFVVGDIISFVLQCGGGGYMSAGSADAMQSGEHIVIAGLAIQLLFFGFFMFIAFLFHWRVTKTASTYKISEAVKSQSGQFSWHTLMWALYGACVLILVRSIFRVIEFVQGNDGSIMRSEYLLYIFDGTLMVLMGAILGVVFPGSFLSGRGQAARWERTVSDSAASDTLPLEEGRYGWK